MNVITVSDITKYIKKSMDLDTGLANVFIRGEVSNFKQHYSGHCYFTLKDKNASIKSVMFKSKAQYLKFMPTNGMKVVANGSITVFERDGMYQLYVNMLLPEGAGELSLTFEQLKSKLSDEGLFASENKKSIPVLSQRIGIVTSATGAVLHDIYTVAKRRNPKVSLFLYPVQVQGSEAAGQIAAAIEFFNARYPVDVLIVGRGGGSIEDLWAFNEEIVVRAIFASKIPVIAAVGHETDYTLTDFVADLRAATPSQAAELAVKDATEMCRYIDSLASRLNLLVQRILLDKHNQLKRCQENKAFTNPQVVLNQKKQLTDYLTDKLVSEQQKILQNKKHHLMVLLEKLQMLNPAAILGRGYSFVKSENAVVKSVEQLQPQTVVDVIVADGEFSAVVTNLRRRQGEDEILY